jgi:nucleotide-binding universal stress UspA family protein
LRAGIWNITRRCDGLSYVFELGTDGPSRILVAIDNSETSLRAGAYAAGLARRQGSRMVCLFVGEISPLVSAMPAATGAAIQMNHAIAEQIRTMVNENAPRLGLEVTFLERTGDPFTEIVRVADELRVDAVVVGASTSGGHRWVGSIATRLVKIARWPVTVVP